MSLAALAVTLFFSVTEGARDIGLATILDALFNPDPGNVEHTVVRDLRLPRTAIGLAVGAALGASGTILQGATRNPLADPGILGLHAGAALAVVFGIVMLDIHALSAQVCLALAGAGVAMTVVYSVAAVGREGATPVKLALSGAALSAAMMSVTSALLISSVDALEEIRFWQVGSLAGRPFGVLLAVLPFLAVGFALAIAVSRLLDGLALGDDVARALGHRVRLSRGISLLAAVILAGAATAVAGPIAFIGLTVPHIARVFVGTSYRWILPYSMVLAPALLLFADILGRVVARPGEVQVGIVTAMIGAPVFIALVRKRRPATL